MINKISVLNISLKFKAKLHEASHTKEVLYPFENENKPCVAWLFVVPKTE